MKTVETDSEHVLVVPTRLFHECGHFQGFHPDDSKYLDVLLDQANTEYLPRDRMEQDPTYKQLIPYCIFRYTCDRGTDWIFQYRRGNNQGERRLHSKRSIGIGGHISTLDLGEASPYLVGMNRELDEEVRIETTYDQECIGLINDDSNDVGKVHLGVVHLFDVAEPAVYSNETEIVDAGFKPTVELEGEIEQFETWSQICLNELLKPRRSH